MYKRRQRLAYERALQIGIEVSYGMHYLHSLPTPIAHRDLKPHNILLAADGAAKVADFGLSAAVRGGTMTTCGTPAYLAPGTSVRRPTAAAHTRTLAHSFVCTRAETVVYARYGAASDVYALGIVLCEMFANEQPYPRHMGGMRVLYEVIKLGRRPTLPAHMPHAYAQLVRACLSADAAERPSLKNVVLTLKALLRDGATVARVDEVAAHHYYTAARAAAVGDGAAADRGRTDDER